MYRLALKTKPGGKDWSDRFSRVHWLAARLSEFFVEVKKVTRKLHILLEGYAYGARGNAVLTMAEVKTAILMAVRLVSDTAFSNVLLLPPNAWQKCLMGDDYVPGEGKQQTIDYVRERWPITESFGSDNNLYDAFGMAVLCEQLIRDPYRTNNSIERLRIREQRLKRMKWVGY